MAQIASGVAHNHIPSGLDFRYNNAVKNNGGRYHGKDCIGYGRVQRHWQKHCTKAGFSGVPGICRRPASGENGRFGKQGVFPIALDLTQEESIRVCVQTVLTREGHIDVLVNNAGYGSYGAVEDVPMEEARRQFEVNLFGMAG